MLASPYNLLNQDLAGPYVYRGSSIQHTYGSLANKRTSLPTVNYLTHTAVNYLTVVKPTTEYNLGVVRKTDRTSRPRRTRAGGTGRMGRRRQRRLLATLTISYLPTSAAAAAGRKP